MLSRAAFVNGGCKNICGLVPKLIACYYIHLMHTVRYVI